MLHCVRLVSNTFVFPASPGLPLHLKDVLLWSHSADVYEHLTTADDSWGQIPSRMGGEERAVVIVAATGADWF